MCVLASGRGLGKEKREGCREAENGREGTAKGKVLSFPMALSSLSTITPRKHEVSPRGHMTPSYNTGAQWHSHTVAQ